MSINLIFIITFTFIHLLSTNRTFIFTFTIYIFSCIVVKPYLQDILTCCDLLSVGQDLVPVHPLTHLTACSIHHLIHLIAWHSRFHNCTVLLPICLLHLLLLLIPFIQTETSFMCRRSFFPVLHFTYRSVLLKTVFDKMNKQSTTKASVIISPGRP